jgi:hypothetical protein
MSQPNNKISVDRTEVKSSVLSRTERAEVIGTNGPSSPIWKANEVLQDMGLKLVAVGVSLKAAQAAVNSIESQLDVAHGVRDTRTFAFDTAYELYATSVEASSNTAEDAAGLGITVRTRTAYTLTMPLEVQARFDPRKSLIRIHVKRAPGMRTCIIEISTDPADPAGWRRLPGVGAVQALSGYAPGTYWVRAANTRASAQSEFTTPVAVFVM